MSTQGPAPQIARKHHYVTAAYLARFTNTGTKKGLLSAVDFSTKKFFPAKPDDVAYELDFNRIEIDGMAPDALETAMGPVEGRAIREIRKIYKSGKLPDMDAFSYICNLITLFAVRHPAVREAALVTERQVARVMLDIMTSTTEMYEGEIRRAKEAGFIRADLNVSYDQMKDFARRDAYTISIPTQRHIHREFTIFPELLDKVAKRYWSVMTVKSDAPDLITCDRPAPTRLGEKTIVFTIGPRHALLGALELYAPAEFEIDASAVAEINTQLAEQAIKQIYSRTSHVTLLGDGKLITCDLRQIFSGTSGK
jgi:hypothetical protein